MPLACPGSPPKRHESQHGGAATKGHVPVGAIGNISYAACMPDMSDEKLMVRYAKGDATAFDELYSRHRGPLYRYFVRQINEPATANDLYQGAWEKIIKARKSYRPELPFTAWMYRIAHNHLVDYFRRLRPEQDLDSMTLADEQSDPLQTAGDRERDLRLRESIVSLPADQRDTLLLKLETGLKMEDIAELTGVSRETVKSRLRYAVNKLKRSLVNEHNA